MSNRAWVTLATNDSYGLGALVLAHSLRRAGSVYPAVVLITPSVTDAMKERLNAIFSEVVVVDVLDSRDAAHLALLQRPELGITFTKIHCWSLTQYEKCVFLDADTLVVQNCDELFEREELSAAPDVGWPDCFNSGVFVFRPSADTFDRLIAFAQERGSFDGGDQGLLNSFFSDWARGDINKHLPFLYNVTSAAFYSYLPALKHFGQDLKIIHFIGAAKPWLQHFNFQSRSVDAPDHIRGLLQLWWDIFVGQVHSELDATMVEVEEPPELPPPALPPHDVSQHFHYQPVIDSESEFPWHRPEAQTIDQYPERNLELPDIHDPWKLYRGNIPPMPKEHISNAAEPLEEIRQYAWNYHHREIIGQENRIQATQPPTHTHNSYEHHQHSQSHSDHPSHIHQHYYNQQTSSSYHDQSHHGHRHHDVSDHFHHENHHHYDHAYSQTHTDHQQQSCQPYDHTKDPYDSFSRVESPIHHIDVNQTQENTYHQIDNLHKFNEVKKINDVAINHVHVHSRRSRRPRRHRIDLGAKSLETNGLANGDISEEEYFEDIIPRHPYDGFYLRHRATIDSRGRKICTHEIPPTPSPTPSPPESPTPQDYDTAEDNFATDSEDQSGVAGNLARVVAGASNEALDDLTRRQGWEAGNIDYMGADSFDNIWAKISQTLTQPRSSPPKESQPEIPVQTGEVAKEVSEPVEIAKEAVPIAAPVVPEVPTVAEATPPTPIEEVAPPIEPVKVTPVVEPAVLADIPVTVLAAEAPKEEPKKTETEQKETQVEAPKVAEAAPVVEPAPEKPVVALEAPVVPSKAPVVAAKAPVVAAEAPVVLSEAPAVAAVAPAATDSPPLANTPSKEEAPEVPAAKSEERRKVGKLRLSPPAASDPLPTPDSEAEDAATLAHSIIAGELRAAGLPTPTVSSPQTPTAPAAPVSPSPALGTGLTVQEPQVPTPPVAVGAVSLAQIGVKPKEKTTTASRLESSIAAAEKVPSDAPKKKIVKKVVKKTEGASAVGADAPVPPPRKKEKKPKEK